MAGKEPSHLVKVCWYHIAMLHTLVHPNAHRPLDHEHGTFSNTNPVHMNTWLFMRQLAPDIIAMTAFMLGGMHNHFQPTLQQVAHSTLAVNNGDAGMLSHCTRQLWPRLKLNSMSEGVMHDIGNFMCR